jgi:DNA-binding PadR family transcriptional regulator
MEAPRQPSLGAWAVLGLLCEGDAHGWALVRALAPDGEIGRVWSIRRALVYRTVDLVAEAGMVERAGVERGTRGSTRTLLRATPHGRRSVASWLAEPVVHVRELRSSLLLKLLFMQRSGLDPTPLLQAQRAILTDLVEALGEHDPDDGPFEVSVRAFRLETARAGLRFVDGELARSSVGAS